MPIPPRYRDRIVADRRYVPNLRIAPLPKFDLPGMPLTIRARAVSAQNIMRINGFVPIGPFDMHDGGPVGSLDVNGMRNLRRHRGRIMVLYTEFARSKRSLSLSRFPQWPFRIQRAMARP